MSNTDSSKEAEVNSGVRKVSAFNKTLTVSLIYTVKFGKKSWQ